jgi:hypothetical protein
VWKDTHGDLDKWGNMIRKDTEARAKYPGSYKPLSSYKPTNKKPPPPKKNRVSPPKANAPIESGEYRGSNTPKKPVGKSPSLGGPSGSTIKKSSTTKSPTPTTKSKLTWDVRRGIPSTESNIKNAEDKAKKSKSPKLGGPRGSTIKKPPKVRTPKTSWDKGNRVY